MQEAQSPRRHSGALRLIPGSLQGARDLWDVGLQSKGRGLVFRSVILSHVARESRRFLAQANVCRKRCGKQLSTRARAAMDLINSRKESLVSGLAPRPMKSGAF